MKALAYANGVIVFAAAYVRNTLPIAEAHAKPLRAAVEPIARRGYDGKTLLVPGLPEACSWDERSKALVRFTAEVQKRLGKPALARRIQRFEARKAQKKRAAKK